MIVCTEIALLIGNYLAKLRLKPINNDSVFFDFRVYKAFL